MLQLPLGKTEGLRSIRYSILLDADFIPQVFLQNKLKNLAIFADFDHFFNV